MIELIENRNIVKIIENENGTRKSRFSETRKSKNNYIDLNVDNELLVKVTEDYQSSEPQICQDMVTKYWKYEPGSHHHVHIKKLPNLEEKILIPQICGEINVPKLYREIYYNNSKTSWVKGRDKWFQDTQLAVAKATAAFVQFSE